MVHIHDPRGERTINAALETPCGAVSSKAMTSDTPPTSVESSTSFDWDPDAVIAARQSRSQSLTDARTMATLVRHTSTDESPTLASEEGDLIRSVTFVVVDTNSEREREHEQLVAQRHLRRTKSAEFVTTSLSLLQQELGYPRPHKPSTSSSSSTCSGDHKATPTRRQRRSSRRSSHKEDANANENADANKTRPASTSDAATATQSDQEADDEEAGDDDDNFLNHRVASVTGYARDTDGVIYYEIVVESTAHGPLSAYKVRRRFSEFHELHRALAKVMRPRPRQRQGQCQGFAARASLAGPLDPIHTSTCSPTDASSPHDCERGPTLSLVDVSSRSAASGSGLACRLPPMPDSGGVWSYFQAESPRFLETRARGFHAIVTAAQQHPLARASRLLNRFLGPPPDSFATSNYVSLNRFAAPTLRFAIEIQERKEMAKTISLKRRQLDPQPQPPHPPSIAE